MCVYNVTKQGGRKKNKGLYGADMKKKIRPMETKEGNVGEKKEHAATNQNEERAGK
jgi:hypothetical protein